MKKALTCITIFIFVITNLFHTNWHTKAPSITQQNLGLIQAVSALVDMPWEILAAVHQFEENIQPKNKSASQVSICISPRKWCGPLNSNTQDSNPNSIRFFGGIGRDGSGNGTADSENPTDVLYTIAHYLTQHGTTQDSIARQLWQYYKNPVTVDVIIHTAKIFKKYQRVDLYQRVFPIPKRYVYDYENTWGDSRGYGGNRRHEGTDIYAHYGTPVLSTCYGYVEIIGWNKYGGWRIGIRDIRGTYHYFAHLRYFKKGLKKGVIVKPGDMIGSVGSSGYGPAGTQGKFPPHLHFGLYRYNGKTTYAFNPYLHLKKWEKTKKKNKKKETKSK